MNTTTIGSIGSDESGFLDADERSVADLRDDEGKSDQCLIHQRAIAQPVSLDDSRPELPFTD